MASAWPAAEALRPRRRTSELRGEIDLDVQVPRKFGAWALDPSLLPLLPDPQSQAVMDATYTQVLARTYRNTEAGPAAGARPVMLSIAYGNDQATEATAVHRPEFCYRAQGFEMTELDDVRWRIGAGDIPVRRMVGRLAQRNEPISYWITLDQTATLPGLGRKWQQIRHGLSGWIADGMLVRLSTLGPADEVAYNVHRQFATDLFDALSLPLRARFFGRAAAGPAA